MTDNMDFDLPRGDDFWNGVGADSWRMGDMEDYHRLLSDDAGEAPLPEEAPPVESRAARREREEAERKNAAKKPRRAKAPKADETVPEDDPFWRLSSSRGDRGPAPEEPEPEGEPPEPERGGRGGKKPPKEKRSRKEKPEPDPEEAAKKAEKAGKDRLTVIVLAVVLTLLVVGITLGGYLVTGSDRNLPNIYVDEIFVGGMTREETDAVLLEQGWDQTVDTALRVKLPARVSFKVDSCQSGAKLTRARAVEAAYAYGHSGNWYVNLYKYLLNYLAPTDVDLDDRHIDKAYVTQRIAKGVEKLDKATADTGYEIDDKSEQLKLVKGAGEIKLDTEALYAAIEAALLADQRELSFDQFTGTLTMPDFQKLHDQLAIEPADAYYTEDFQVVDEIKGCWFDVSKAEQLWKDAQPTQTVCIPLELTFPEVTGAALREMLFRDKLGSQTTYYTWSTDNRINNINLAAGKLNGIVLMPGQELSYNETVGQRTEEAGFLPAGAYDDGQVVEEIGGGICQVSSTLYCATMFAQLDTVSRTNHYFKVDYLEYGLDATVSWPKPDFKFRNSRAFPVKIVAYCDDSDKSLTIEIWGTDEDGTYVTLRHTSLCVYDTEFVDVHIGFGVSAFRTVYDAEGNFLYEVEEPYGIYHFHDEEISWPAEKWMTDEEKAALQQAYSDDVPSEDEYTE